MVQVPVVAWFPISDGSAQLIPYRLAVGIVLPLGSRGGCWVGVGQPWQARDVDEVLLDGPENAATNEAQQADDASDDANGSERRIGTGLLALVGGVGGLGDFGLVGFRIDCFRSFRLSGRGCLSRGFGVIGGCGVCGGGGCLGFGDNHGVGDLGGRARRGGFLGVGDSAGKAQTYSNCEGDKCFTHTQRLAVFFYYENSFLCKIVAFYLILGVIGLPEGNL